MITKERFTLALVIAAAAILVFAIGMALGAKDTIDCGPEGKPALNGTACIDKEPAITTYP